MTAEHSLFRRLPARRAYQEIVEQIADLIYSRKLNPGDRFPSERELALQFGTGRMAVREAFRVLEQIGLIGIKQGTAGGAFVKEADVTVVSDSMCNLIRRMNIDLENFIKVRTGVDRLIVEAVMENMSDELYEKLRRNVDETSAAMAEQDAGKHSPFMPKAAHFHLELARATRNPLFEMLEESLLKVMRTFMSDGAYDFEFHIEHLKIHKLLCEALRDGNLPQAFECLRAHSAHMLTYLSPGVPDSLSGRQDN
jgi:GntR family transcriptional regulator, transcriptional repressor for pyruvate dehydrogenase complex